MTVGPPAPLPFLADLPAYSTAPQAPVPVRFRASSNEAPLPASPRVRAAAAAALGEARRYPTILAADLVERLAAHHKVDVAQIAVADGALSLLNHVLTAYVAPGSTVVSAWRSYEAYPIAIATAGAQARMVPLRSDHSLDLPAMAAAVDATTSAIILCSPNNPTGCAVRPHALAELLRTVPARVLVVLDEAYVDFVDETLVPRPDSLTLIAAHPNLVSLRTFSKVHALAGLRVGYLLAHPGVAQAVRAVAPPFPVSAPGVAAASAALDDDQHAAAVVRAVRHGRAELTAVLRGRGLPVVGEHANFVWLPVGAAARELGARLRAQGIATRVFDDEGVRITVGEQGLADAVDAALAG